MTYDSLLEEELGGFGWWQAVATTLLWTGSFYTGMAFLAYPFVFASPEEFHCAVLGCDGEDSAVKDDDSGGDGLTYGTCNVLPTTCTNSTFTKECHEWVYDTSVYQSTAVTQYDLVCSRYVPGSVYLLTLCQKHFQCAYSPQHSENI